MILLQLMIFVFINLHINEIIVFDQRENVNYSKGSTLKKEASPLIDNPFQKVFEDLGIKPQNGTIPPVEYNVLGKLRDNDNFYQQVWTPWLSRAAVHVAKVSDDGEFFVVGGGYLLDTELHIYRWNTEERTYMKVWEAGSGIITSDVYDVAFGDCDNNLLIEVAAACADGVVYLFEQAHIQDPIANLENRFDFVWKSDDFFQASSVEFYDLDLDGIQDLVIGAWDKKIHVFEYTDHSGYPFDVEHWIELTERWNSSELDDKIQSLGVGDFDDNGLPDIIVGTLSGSVYIFENNGVIMAPHGIEFPFPQDNSYRLEWNNSGLYQPIWNPIGQIATGDLDGLNGTDAVLLAWGQGAWTLHYDDSRGYYLDQLIQEFEAWQMQGAYPLDNFADWMIRDKAMNWQVYTQHISGTKYPEPWDFDTQNELDPMSNSAVTGPPLSNHGGSLYDEHEYKLFSSAKTFPEAKADCEARGGHLVTITSGAENNFVSSLAGTNTIWLGLTDSEAYGASEGNWKWVTGESFTYSHWNSGEPNNLYDEDFVNMYSNGYWNDLDPGYKRYYVCEWEAWEDIFTVFAVNRTHKNATGTWNLGVGEELASNGNSDPDLYIIFDDSETIIQPDEWNVSVGNNLVNWHQINNTDISAMITGKGLAIDIDPLFAKKKMMSAQYIRLTLTTSAEEKARKLDAIVFPYVARPLTIAASVTITPISFSYDEQETNNRIIFGGSDGRLLAFRSELNNVTYYRKYRDREAVLSEIPAVSFGMVLSSFTQDWDSYTDDFFNLGETIWSIQGTPKKPLIPSWRYINGETDQISGLMTLHHVSVSDSGAVSPGPELLVTRTGDTNILIYDAFDGTYYGTTQFNQINSYYAGSKVLTLAFGDLDKGYPKDELITFPWFSGPDFTRPDTYDESLLPLIWRWDGSDYDNEVSFNDLDGHLYGFLAKSITYPSATIIDVNNDSLEDIILSNGQLAILWNVGTNTTPSFKFDFDYFEELNERAPSQPIFSPNAWDYDKDGDYDIAYSYGRGSGELRYGMDFFENSGTPTESIWVRNAYVFKNPTTVGSLRFNNYTAGVIIPSDSYESSAESLWVWNGKLGHLRELVAETDQQNSFIIGTNPELMKLEVNLKQSAPNAINFGYSIVKSWSNLDEIADWTLTFTTSYNLDGDNNAEIIVSDYDNNVYVFEHLVENTYKRAYRTHDLNHTEMTDFSPYAFQELTGVPGTFQRTIFDHGNLLTAGLDYNENGNEEFIITAGLQIYIFEATGFNDEFKLAFEIDYRNMVTDPDVTQFTTLAITPDFDGRGSMIALGVSSQLFLLRWDSAIGWLESFQSLDGSGFYNQPGNPNSYPNLDIQAMLFADINQDNTTELWVGGINHTGTETGFLLALQSDFGNVHHIYDFPSISTSVNALATSDSDFDDNLELIIAHAEGIDIWEVEKEGILSFNRTEIISSDPDYGSESDLEATFNTYNSPVGLTARAHDIEWLDTGNYFVVYGVEQESHDPIYGEKQLVDMSNSSIGDGRLYFSVASDPKILGSVKNIQQQVYNAPEDLLISEIFYNNSPIDTKYHWIELYNPNIFDVSLEKVTIQTITNNVTLSGTIFARDYFVIARNSSVFTTRYGIPPNMTSTNLEFDSTSSNTITLYNDGIEIDSVDLFPISSSRQRKNVLNAIQTAYIPLDTDSVVFDWEDRPVLGSDGTPFVRNYDKQDGIELGVEYEPVVTQLHNGTIFTAWVHTFTHNSGTLYSRCVLSRNFNENGKPISNIRLIDRITSSVADPSANIRIRGLSTLQVSDETDDFLYLCFTKFDPFNPDITLFMGNLTLKTIQNGVLLDKSSTLGLEDYFIHSTDIVNVRGSLGIIFAGYSFDAFTTIQQLYFTTLNSTYHNQGIFPITSSRFSSAQYPSASNMAYHSDRIMVVYERITGGVSEVASVYSSNFGTTWSDSYGLNSDDPYLVQTEVGLETEDGIGVTNRYNYRPRVTDDGTGGIYYQFVSRFLISNDSNPLHYSGNYVNIKGVDYILATQLWTSPIGEGCWFKFSDIIDVKAIAVGDSDNDLRNELFVSLGYQVALLEINQDAEGIISYVQKWQYQPPLVVSLHPELLNETYTEFFVSDTARAHEIGAVSIFDGNGNGWPELIFTVRGGDVFSFEVSDLNQPINDLYAITEEYDLINYLNISQVIDNLLLDVNNDGELDLVIADGKLGNGISAWNMTNNALLWNYSTPTPSMIEKIYLINSSSELPVILGITSFGVCGVNLDGSQRYWIKLNGSLVPTNNHVFADVNGDRVPDLIVANATIEILAIDPIDGDSIWEDVKPDNTTHGYFDFATGSIGSTKRISVCSSDFSTYKRVNILDINGSIVQTLNLTHLTKFDTRSQSAIGDFDGDLRLDLAIAIFDNYANESHLEVYDLSTLETILNATIPVDEGLDLSDFSMYSRDANDNYIVDLILAINNFNSSTSLFPSKGYTSAIFAIDVGTTSLIWKRYFVDSLDKFEISPYGDNEILYAYTSNSGLFALSMNGADVFWTDLDSQSVSVSIADSQKQTYIAVTCVNGTTSVFKVLGMLTRASNIITLQPNIVQTNMKILYSESVSFTMIPVIVTNDETEKLLVAFNNGTLILRSFDQGELWRIQVAAFSSISASGLEIEPRIFGLAFKTDTSDLFILERTTTNVWTQVPTSGSIVTSLTLDDNSDVLLLQSISGISGTLSLFDPNTKKFFWTYTSPTYFTYLKAECFDPANIGVKTHIVALDYLGTASLIELPSTFVLGGSFGLPGIGTKWVLVKSIENSDQLADVVLLSDGGQLIRYSWLPNGGISKVSYSVSEQEEIVSIDVVDQGPYNNILLNSRHTGSHVLKDDGSAITVVNNLKNFYTGSYDHHFANIDDSTTDEIVIALQNSLTFLTSEGNSIESHSFPDEIIMVKNWKVDTTMKAAFITISKNGIIAVADPSDRILTTQNGKAASIDFRNKLPSDQYQDDLEGPNGGKIQILEIILPIFLITCISISPIIIIQKHGLHINRRRRF